MFDEDRDTPGERCRDARRGRVEGVCGVPAESVSIRLRISRITLATWERYSDPRLVELWRGLGLSFDGCCRSEVLRLDRDRTATAATSPVRVLWLRDARLWTPQRYVEGDPARLDEYALDAAAGLFRFHPGCRVGRRLVVAYLADPPATARLGALAGVGLADR